MAEIKNPGILQTISLLIIVLFMSFPAYAKYGGGTGEPNDPYQIATAEDLMLLGNSPDDYDKHFILTNDIDLDPNLPGRKVFGGAVIHSFSGVFDGQGHTISNLSITGKSYLGLFSRLDSKAKIKNISAMDGTINSSGDYVGCLVGLNLGHVTDCYSTGVVSGHSRVGGLVGRNEGSIIRCHSTGTISATASFIGGLVGSNLGGFLTCCYSTGTVSSYASLVGGLVGFTNGGGVSHCYSTSTVSGSFSVGGLVGSNHSSVSYCYSTGPLSDTGERFGGLIGSNSGEVTACFWDIETSGQVTSDGGTGKTTAQMRNIQTYLDTGWDLVGEIENGTSQIWQMPDGGGYPVLATLNGYTPEQLLGRGTPDDPYLIFDAMELGAIVYYSSDAHYRMAASIDLSGIHWGTAVIPSFRGRFDGNGHTISHLTIKGGGCLALFSKLESGSEVKDLGVVDVNIAGSGDRVGGMAGSNSGVVVDCYSSGTVSGHHAVGGLVGHNDEDGNLITSSSAGIVTGTDYVGGLVGLNAGYSSVTPSEPLGLPYSDIWAPAVVANCYSMSSVSGIRQVGGAVGLNGMADYGYHDPGIVLNCYSTGTVLGNESVGGLVGDNEAGTVHESFWDVATTGQATSAGGIGKTTAEMQAAATFLEAGWDFVDETANGTDDIWWILEGQDYPRLWWEAAEQ